MTFLAVVSSPLPSSHVSSSILSKFRHKNNFWSGVTPWRVSLGAVPPDATVEWRLTCYIFVVAFCGLYTDEDCITRLDVEYSTVIR